jgi:hypothetical protein
MYDIEEPDTHRHQGSTVYKYQRQITSIKFRKITKPEFQSSLFEC